MENLVMTYGPATVITFILALAAWLIKKDISKVHSENVKQYTEINSISRDIVEIKTRQKYIEDKVTKHNNFQDRLTLVESKIGACFRIIDSMKGKEGRP